MFKNINIGIIGLGYVGLPLAVEFGRKYSTIGYDVNNARILELKNNIDIYGETSKKDFSKSINLNFTSDINDIKKCNVYIVTVPTPVDDANIPDISILLNACKQVSLILDKNDIIVFESTVYPGCTEEDCVPLIEEMSGYKYNKDFFCAYSPERISPGDKDKTLTKIIKITSGGNKATLEFVDKLYNSIIKAGTFPVSSIKIAEAAKIIENCQRDINIAFVNELSILFNLMNINSNEVIEAASTKWNFMKYKPGLVGGHCIGVDPYYLTYKAKKVGYSTSLINQARKLNDEMSQYVCNRIFMYFKSLKKNLESLKILILGITFKEDCSDTRNSKVVDIYKRMISENIMVDVCDDYAISNDVKIKYNIDLKKIDSINDKYDCVIITVAHKMFFDLNPEKYLKNNDSIIFDVKNIYSNTKYMRL